MKFLKYHGESLVFELGPRERELLVMLLRRYPLLNPDYHQIAKPKHRAPLAEAQQMLVEAMTAQHRENRRIVDAFIADKLRTANAVKSDRTRTLLPLTRPQADWLLEVLNDLRVGCWVRLGRPDSEDGRALALSAGNVADFGAMEFAGYLQSLILAALDG